MRQLGLLHKPRNLGVGWSVVLLPRLALSLTPLQILQQCLHTRYDFTYVVSLAKVERKLFESGELTMTVEEFEKYLLELYAEISDSVSPLMKVSEKVAASKNSFLDAVLQLQRERVCLCVQCKEEFKDSVNVEGCCMHHRSWYVSWTRREQWEREWRELGGVLVRFGLICELNLFDLTKRAGLVLSSRFRFKVFLG